MVDTLETSAEPGRARALADRLHLRRVLSRDVLILAALSGLALTQPLLDLFGRNPEFFIAQEIGRREIVVFALVVAFLVPLVCLVIELVAYAIGERVGRAVHVALVAILASVLGLSLANQLGAGDALSFGIAVAVGVGVALASVKVRAVEQLLRYLSASLLLFLVAFLFFSRTGELLRGGEASAARNVRIGTPAPVVVVVYDEFPVASLLETDGSINAERFPNFDRLAEQSSWFRNARSLSTMTTVSMPAALSGTAPGADPIPISGEFPRTLFTLLGEDYRFFVDEPITDLCPSALCAEDRPERVDEPVPEVDLVGDTLVVLGHRTLPPSLVDDLPSVDQSWGGFLADEVTESPDPEPLPEPYSDEPVPSDPLAKWKDQGPDIWAPRYQASILEQQVASVAAHAGPLAPPTLWFSHAVFPHAPWHLDPDGREYRRGDSRFTDGQADRAWVEEEFVVRQALQRHLLQAGYADTMLGQLIDELEATGVWEDALVVVMADHGVSFVPGESARDRVNFAEVYNVPLFIKPPGITTGETRDDAALLVDVFPSIVDLLDIRTEWEFDGISLFDEDAVAAESDTVRAFAPNGGRADLDELLAVVERNETWIPHGDDWPAVAAVGEFGALVGEPVASLDVVGQSDMTWTLDQADELDDWRPAESRFVPLLWRGTVVDPDGGSPPPEMLAVVNGHVAGIVGGFGQFGDDEWYSAVISAEWLAEGRNDVELLVPVAGGAAFERAGPPA